MNLLRSRRLRIGLKDFYKRCTFPQTIWIGTSPCIVTLAYNSSCQDTTSSSQFFLPYGRKPTRQQVPPFLTRHLFDTTTMLAMLLRTPTRPARLPLASSQPSQKHQQQRIASLREQPVECSRTMSQSRTHTSNRFQAPPDRERELQSATALKWPSWERSSWLAGLHHAIKRTHTHQNV